MRMRIFFGKVELINDRIKQNKLDRGFSPQSEIKYAPSAEQFNSKFIDDPRP